MDDCERPVRGLAGGEQESREHVEMPPEQHRFREPDAPAYAADWPPREDEARGEESSQPSPLARTAGRGIEAKEGHVVEPVGSAFEIRPLSALWDSGLT